MGLTAKAYLSAILVSFILLSIAMGGVAQEDESYSVQLDGRKTWSLQWGFGDALGLAASGLSAGQLSLDQTLAVDISGEALSILTVEAHFNDQQADSLQSLAIYLDTDRLDGVLGDFVAAGIGGLAAFGKKMRGLQLEYTLGGAVLTGVASKLEGISETKTYVGQKAHEEITYSKYSPDDPSRLSSYERGIDGLHAYPLTVYYVEEFSEVDLVFASTNGLQGTLNEYGLSYLVEFLGEGGSFSLDSWEFLILEVEENQDQVLLLSEDVDDLVRDRLEEAIDLYNEENDLSGDDKKEYPFSRDTGYEIEFLERVAADVQIAVDSEIHPILDAVRNRYYDLGREGVVVDSVVVEVSEDGETFDPITDPAYADYAVEVFSEEGILDIDFPEAFFSDESAIRVSFDYTVTGGIFMLGLSIIPESDRVSVNDEPLVRDTDYLIDYEIGMLALLIEVQETDVIRIDYERFSGGIFGGGADYATYFYGLTLDWPVSEALTIQASLLQSAEDPGSVTDPESVKTMPNRHTVAGLSGRVSLDDFSADFLIAYSNDRFPYDDNARINRPNEIAAIASDEEYVFFGHRSGLAVKRGNEWLTYGTQHGLAGTSIRAIAVEEEILFIGTNSGLTVVSLDGISPLDRIGNWTNYYASEEAGLPSASITALWIDNEDLWVGTEAGLVGVHTEELDQPEAWSRFDDAPFETVTALVGDGESLYVGTVDGLYLQDPLTGTWDRLPGSEGTEIHDLAVSGGTLYVASSRGLRSYRDGIGTGWLVLGEEVSAVEVVDGMVFYGTEAGLIDASNPDPMLADSSVTALAQHGGTLWIGSEANANYELTIWSLAEDLEAFGSSETGIDGRDPFGFVDANPEEHTTEGFVERASFRHAGDDFTLSGRFENVSPTYRSIGSTGRSDLTGWDLAGTWELGSEANVSASHTYDIVGRLGGDPAITTSNDLSLEWTFGPSLTAAAHRETSNRDSDVEGPESTETSYRFALRDRVFAERLEIGLSWSDVYTWSVQMVEPRRDSRLSLSVSGAILPSWSAQLEWGRPIRVSEGEWSGSERLTFGTAWAGADALADYEIDYTLDWSRSIPGGTSRRDHEIELDVDVVPFEVSGWAITPGARIGASSDESDVDINARLTGRGRRGDLSIQGSLRTGWAGLGSPVVRESDKLTLSASYSGIKELRPSLSYSIDRQVAVYETQRQATIGHSLTGRVAWTPDTIHRDELSFSLTNKGSSGDRSTTARFENSYRMDLRAWMGAWWIDSDGGSAYPALDLRVDTDIYYRSGDEHPDVDATTTARLNAALSPTWSGSFGLSYLGGTSSTGDYYHSLLLDLTVAIDF